MRTSNNVFVYFFQTDVSLWRTVFIIAACVYIVSDIFFVVFAKGDVQWWNDIKDEKTENVEKNEIVVETL